MEAAQRNGELGDAMRQRLEARVEELKRELALGEERLRTLGAEQARVRETVLRLEGAVLAYGELLDGDGGRSAEGLGGADTRERTATEEPIAG